MMAMKRGAQRPAHSFIYSTKYGATGWFAHISVANVGWQDESCVEMHSLASQRINSILRRSAEKI
jgi:hypothetical protein